MMKSFLYKKSIHSGEIHPSPRFEATWCIEVSKKVAQL